MSILLRHWTIAVGRTTAATSATRARVLLHFCTSAIDQNKIRQVRRDSVVFQRQIRRTARRENKWIPWPGVNDSRLLTPLRVRRSPWVTKNRHAVFFTGVTQWQLPRDTFATCPFSLLVVLFSSFFFFFYPCCPLFDQTPGAWPLFLENKCHDATHLLLLTWSLLLAKQRFIFSLIVSVLGLKKIHRIWYLISSNIYQYY